MRDPSNLPRINLLHPKVANLFRQFIDKSEEQLNITIYVVSTLRTFEEQQQEYNKGRTAPGPIVTWSPPGSSYHNYGLAADICPFKSGAHGLDWNYDFSKLATIAAEFGITWGGNFPVGKKDPDHFENKMGYNWRDLLHKYNEKAFIAGTNYVNI